MKNNRRFSISLSTLNILSVSVAAIAAVSVCIAIFAAVYSNSLLKDARVSSRQAVELTALSVDNYFSSVKQKLIKTDEIAEKSTSVEEFESKMAAFALIQDDVYAVSIYKEDSGILSCTGNGKKIKENVYRDLSFDSSLFENGGDYAVSPPHVQTLFEGEYPWVVTFAVKCNPNVLERGKYIAMDCSFSEIAKYIDNVGIGRHGYCFITDKYGNIVYHPQQQLIFSGLKSEDCGYIESVKDGTYVEDNVIRTVKTTNDGRWRIVGIGYTEEFAEEKRTQIAMSILYSLIFCTLIALIVLLVYSKIVSIPVKRITESMRRFEKDAKGFSFAGGDESVKEIRDISDSFSHLTGRVKKLMEQVRSEETQLRKTELKALQAQINPHFLYNTLDSIQWMCERGKTEDASKMVCALAKLFRISISRGHELITIKDELKHAENYLIIQSYRYRGQFAYSFDADPALLMYLCNKITIQPLIENAIYHGIDRMVDKGEIKISVKQAEDDIGDIIITVEDNGVGMTKEQCEKILKKERSDSGGIGVKNVNDRLKIYFGEKYGLSIKSEPDEGCTVTVRIPKITGEAENEKK